MLPRPVLRLGLAALVAVGLGTAAGCTSAGSTSSTGSATAGSSISAAGTTSTSTSPTPTPSEATTTAPTTTPAATAPPATDSPATAAVSAAQACATRIVRRMTPAQRVGQLVWVGLDTAAGSGSLDSLVRTRHIGGVVLLGGWSGAARVRSTTTHLQSLVSASSTGGAGLFVSADQEGGEVQQLRGSGFTRIPSARSQDALEPAQLRLASAGWARELARVGVNVNLAPVADTVPASLGTGNGPIGRYGRQFSSDPADNARMVTGFVEGMHDGAVAATVKHFPGLGRIRSNTDVSATGITDTTTTTSDPFLEPFVAGIRAGADFVMVSSAVYWRIDPDHNAVFSSAVVDGLLRDKLAYAGVVVTDDLGAAKAVADVPVGQRATLFVAAGGDVVLTARPSTVPAMTSAVLSRTASDPAFASKVSAAANRVVLLKVARGLARCS